MQPVEWDVVFTDVVPYVVVTPVHQRIDFQNIVMVRVQLDFADLGARHCLLTPEPGHPGSEPLQRPVERLDLAHRAAKLALFHRVVKKIETATAHHILNLQCVGKIHLDADTVARADGVHTIIGFLIEPAGVQSENTKIGAAQPAHHVDQHRLFGLKRAGQRQVRRKLI